MSIMSCGRRSATSVSQSGRGVERKSNPYSRAAMRVTFRFEEDVRLGLGDESEDRYQRPGQHPGLLSCAPGWVKTDGRKTEV